MVLDEPEERALDRASRSGAGKPRGDKPHTGLCGSGPRYVDIAYTRTINV